LGSSALVLLVLFLPARSPYAEIFECTANKAMPTYQNFPCEFDSLGTMPTTIATMNVNPPAAAAAPVAAGAASAATMPKVGMTTKEVKAIWGEPVDTNREEYAKGNIETWTYADSRSIRFDVKGRVSEIKW
jgi:hypothetical protein